MAININSHLLDENLSLQEVAQLVEVSGPRKWQSWGSSLLFFWPGNAFDDMQDRAESTAGAPETYS